MLDNFRLFLNEVLEAGGVLSRVCCAAVDGGGSRGKGGRGRLGEDLGGNFCGRGPIF